MDLVSSKVEQTLAPPTDVDLTTVQETTSTERIANSPSSTSLTTGAEPDPSRPTLVPPTPDGDLPTVQGTTPAEGVADFAGTASPTTGADTDLLLAETLRDCLKSLPQPSLPLSPDEVNDDSDDDSEVIPSSMSDLDQVDKQDSEVVRIAKLVRQCLYIMAGLGDPEGKFENSSVGIKAPFTTSNNVTEILRDALSAVMVLQTMPNQHNSLDPGVESPIQEVEPDSPIKKVEPSSPKTQKELPLTLGRLMGNMSGPPWRDEVMQPLCEALYTEPFDKKNKNYLDDIASSYDAVAYCDDTIKTSDDYITRIHCLVKFLEDSGGNGTMAEFLDIARAQIPGWGLGEKEYTNALYGFWILLHWPLWVPDNGTTFRDKIESIFPPLKRRRQCPPFSPIYWRLGWK
ncbi:hypothetical protein K438DRAFT_642714 [Mycena galopus ATCC 62051]|nr:hypothetical protein K438DRAFT_642714 [Mycena galopus ATCC 62051]